MLATPACLFKMNIYVAILQLTMRNKVVFAKQLFRSSALMRSTCKTGFFVRSCPIRIPKRKVPRSMALWRCRNSLTASYKNKSTSCLPLVIKPY